MKKNLLVALVFSVLAAPASAQNTWAGNSAEDYAEMQDACRRDADRFCGGNTLFVFEMENCLKRHLRRLTKTCRKQLTPTDFRKYYREEAHPFDFLGDF